MQKEIWYDSHWLEAYEDVCSYLKLHHIEKYDLFLEKINPLKTDKNFKEQFILNVFEEAVFRQLKSFIHSISVMQLEYHEVSSFGRFVLHDATFINDLHQLLADRVSSLVGEEVEPSYNFLSQYMENGHCPLHLDAPNSKWTLDVCIEQSYPWPIYISEVEDWPSTKKISPVWANDILQTRKFKEYNFSPNNALLFSGSSQWHYRKSLELYMKNGFSNFIFFHFIPKNTKDIIRPSNWSNLIDDPHIKNLITFS